MLSLTFVAIFAARCVFALPEPLALTAPPSPTCAPSILTTGVVVTRETIITTVLTTGVVITKESIITVPHSCYSYTTTTPAQVGCVTYSCPAHPDCIFIKTLTTFVPPKDKCCKTTGTTTVSGPCYSCQTGCSTSTVWATVTTTGGGTTTDGWVVAVPSHTTTTTSYPPPTPTRVPRAIEKKDPQSFVLSPGCTTTLFRVNEWQLGPTRTAYAWTVTKTATADCGGCDHIVERNLNGLGPAVLYTVTYKDPAPTTTTKFVCATRIVGM